MLKGAGRFCSNSHKGREDDTTREEYPARECRDHSQWNVENQAIVLKQANGRIVYRFQARDLHLVM
jgi:hypothetical protein